MENPTWTVGCYIRENCLLPKFYLNTSLKKLTVKILMNKDFVVDLSLFYLKTSPLLLFRQFTFVMDLIGAFILVKKNDSCHVFLLRSQQIVYNFPYFLFWHIILRHASTV